MTLRYVEEQYKLPIGNAQNTQLSRAIATGAEKGIFVLPKGNIIHFILRTWTKMTYRRPFWEGETSPKER
jgi:hypothetical protein